MKKQFTLALLAAMTSASTAAVAYLDLGNIASAGNGFNNFALTGAENFNGVRGSFNGLQTTDGITSSWNVSATKAGGGGIGGQNAVFTGPSTGVGTPFTGLQNALLQDGIYINNSAALTFTFSGLDISQTYLLDVFGGLDVTNATPADFTLSIGSAFTGAATQVLNVDNSDGNNNGAIASWASITPDATGNISVTVTATGGLGGRRTEVNAIRLESIPEPSSTALLGLGGLALILRRRK